MLKSAVKNPTLTWLFSLNLAILFVFSCTTPSYAMPKSYRNIFLGEDCSITNPVFDIIIKEVKKKNKEAISSLMDCLKLNRKLIFQASLIDPSQFQYAAEILREDENFVHRLTKANPEILKYTSQKLRLNKDFMKQATYLQREALQYADPKLLDNKVFMSEMIVTDYKNYIFASERLKKIKKFANMSFNDNGLYLAYAPQEIKDNRKLVKVAVKSNSAALKFASERLRNDKELKKLAIRKSSIKSKKDLKIFFRKNYLDKSKKKNIGLVLANRMKFFSEKKIIDRNYITKWQKFYTYNNNHLEEEIRLISADSRNYPSIWRDDFREYPGVIKKIEGFFSSHRIDQSTIDSLSTTYLWKVKSDPLTLVFNVYLLRESSDIELGPNYASISSLTAIVQKAKDKWKMTVVQVIFDSEMKMDIAFKDGHKKYDLWDLYAVDEADENPKVIFKTGEGFREFFEVFEEQNGGKYQMIYRTSLTSAEDNLD